MSPPVHTSPSGSTPPALDLPTPEAAALEVSHELVRLIHRDIETAGGRIAFERYMQLALYAPGLGYYAAGARKLGPAGDFVTAPEISTLFSRCVARQTAEILTHLGGGDVLEIGAGQGSMAVAVLEELTHLGVPPGRYLILETSADLRDRQRRALAGAAPAVERVWLDDLPEPGFAGVVLANEVLDAMPVARFVAGSPLREVHVSGDSGVLAACTGAPVTEGLEHAVGDIEQSLGATLAPGYVSEVGLLGRAWLRELLSRLGGAVVLLFDYGYPRPEYYHPQRGSGTLQCHYRHRRHADPFLYPGLQDLTAHVDFTALAEVARGRGMEVAGFTTQAQFLIACGLVEMLSGLEPASPAYLRAAGEVKRLTLPGEMGDVVKVMAIADGAHPPLLGFSGKDLRDRLR